ncbi:MAG: PEP-CTERM-box response regulator transcription factor [Verrucomicrobiota bacterium]
MKPVLLLVDDDEEIRSQMRWALMQDFEVHMAEDRQTAIEAFKKHSPHAVVLDLGLPPSPGDTSEGMATLGDLLALDAKAKIIVATGQGERANAVGAIAAGAYDFLSKPVDFDSLLTILNRAVYVAGLERENRSMQAQLWVFSLIRKVAPSEAPVLVLGESGTGKEVVARTIHRQSNRNQGPFVAINCGAIPENLLESELFGHEKGSFTGAHSQRVGRFEMAHEGTLFLDEIGELPMALQVKLLRFLQDRQIERVGGRSPLEVNTRVVAATNRELRDQMARDAFREDLYFRLAVVTIGLPPLREREGDVRYLAQAFLKKLAGEAGRKGQVSYTSGALRAIDAYHWPGNVRELENRVRRAVIMSEGSRVTAQDLELAGGDSSPIRTLKEAREDLERDMVYHSLRRHRGTISRAAQELGVSRPTLYELIEKLGIGKDKDLA